MAKKGLNAGYVSPGIPKFKAPEYVVVELRHDSRIGYSKAGFAGPADVEKDVTSLNKVLRDFNVKRIASHMGMKAKDFRELTQTLAQRGEVRAVEVRTQGRPGVVYELVRGPKEGLKEGGERSAEGGPEGDLA